MSAARNVLRISEWPWWLTYGLVSGFFVLGTLAHFHLPDFPQKWRFTTPLNLGSEMNPAVWWSGGCMFVASLLALDVHGMRRAKERFAWLLFSLLCLLFACDEIGSIHERTPEYRTPQALFLLAVVALIVIRLGLEKATRRSALAIVSAIALFGTVSIQEELEHALNWPEWLRGLRTSIEEGTELVGVYLLLLAVVSQRSIAETGPGIRRVIPKSDELKFLPHVALAGLVAHVLIALFVSPNLHDFDRRGDPAALYPTFCYLILFLSAVRASLRGTSEKRRWQVLTVLFFVSSVGSMFALTRVIPGAGSGPLHEILSNAKIVLGAQVLVVLAVIWGRRTMVADRGKWGFVGLALVVAGGALAAGLGADGVLIGAVPFLLIVFLAPPRASAAA